MDKQKQIQTEELIGIIQGAVGGCATHWASLIAKEVLKYYQPKIPENAVVLTEKELKEKIDCCDVSMIHHDDDGKRYIEYEKYEDFTDRLGKRIQQLKGQLKQERKETAEKFAERLKGKLELNCNHIGEQRVEYLVGFERKECLEIIDEICKEISEGKA